LLFADLGVMLGGLTRVPGIDITVVDADDLA
jgi:hypothetical protein